MHAYLLFSPTRTREYTRSPFDFDHDFFVQCTKLEGVSLTKAALQQVGQKVLNELIKDCRLWKEPITQITTDFAIWQDYMPAAWNEAICRTTTLYYGTSLPSPKHVYVVLRYERRRIWGGKTYKVLNPLAVYESQETAESAVACEPYGTIVKLPLLGSP